MSIEDGIVDEVIAARFSAWATAKGIPSACPVCASTDRNLAGHLVTPSLIARGGKLMWADTAYPMLMLICNNCGNTQWFSATTVGVFGAGSEADK